MLTFFFLGSAIVFVAILKQFVLKDVLKRYQWVGILLNCMSIILVGFTAMMIEASSSAAAVAAGTAEEGSGSTAFLGVVLILLHRRSGRMMIAFGRSIPVPRTRQALIQMMLASIDLVLAALVLVVLLPGASLALLPGLLLGYLVAITTGLITHAPGGVGVFEAVMLASLPEIDRASACASSANSEVPAAMQAGPAGAGTPDMPHP